jgi:two-component system, NtrC family, response regulator AtoC
VVLGLSAFHVRKHLKTKSLFSSGLESKKAVVNLPELRVWFFECKNHRCLNPISLKLTRMAANDPKLAMPAANELPPENIYFGPSSTMQMVRQRVERAAGLDVPILILGESGTGKEVLARFIHGRSPWHTGPFVKVNCPAIPGTLLESELFGFEKGAFTGATNAKPGRIELAQNGTLFLDEIAELDPSLQAKLLHVLQDGRFTRIGDHEERSMNARLICATNRELRREVESGSFRSDLLFRINVISVMLPPLRERRDDIPYLVEFLRETFNRRFAREAKPVSRETLHLLQHREWPGNVRELENCIARYVILGSEEAFFSERDDKRLETPAFEPGTDGKIPLKRISQQITRRMERELILKVLQANHWNRRKTAEALKISYRALLYKVRQAGLPAKRPRVSSISEDSIESSVPGD